MVSFQSAIVDLSQLALAVRWGSQLHAWLATADLIVWPRCPNTPYPYESCGVGNHIWLPQYRQNHYTYSNVA